MIDAVIIDDEELSRNTLKQLLNKFIREVNVIGEADSVESGVLLLGKTNPNVVFLDINLKDGTGFDILEMCDDISFEVIFVTAYDEFAIKAFQFAAIDYLLKPIRMVLLKDAVKKINNRNGQDVKNRLNHLIDEINSEKQTAKRITIPTANGFEVLLINQIVRCQSDGNYTLFYLDEKTSFLSSKTLKEYSDLLETCGFLRIHRSHIINLDHVKRYVKGKGGEVVMADGAIVPVSRERKEDLLKTISIS
ncbi:MAG: response regulator transcription factor [Flavobacteriales bacterium]|nr:response regulator transcription factor [Flavobacteriales bacterium]